MTEARDLAKRSGSTMADGGGHGGAGGAGTYGRWRPPDR